MNWGKKDKKKMATLGFKIFVSIPWKKIFRLVNGGNVLISFLVFFLVKNDWVPSSTHDFSQPTSGNPSGTQPGTPSTPGKSLAALGQDFLNALKQQAALQGQQPVGNNPVSNQGISKTAGNAAVEVLNGIIPGLGTGLGKIFGFLWTA